jgi:hypothetical protein
VIDKVRARRLKNFFNLTEEEWERISRYQNGVCAISGKKQKSGKRLATDHDHKSGMIRGLLTAESNRLLGKVERLWTVDQIKLVIEYLLHPPAVRALGKEVFTFPGRLGTKRHRKWLLKNKK